MNYTDVVLRVAKLTNYDQGEVDLILRTALNTIAGALFSDERVELRRFGIFDWQYRKGTQRRHPVTKELIPVQEGWVLRFRPSKYLKYKKGTHGEARSRGRRGQGEGGPDEEAERTQDAEGGPPGDERPLGP